ncbi:MAG: hypothetical protein PSV22_19380 [Pseudolabrys sp.]|nr:hypothetical protein [Pseudolabrys sp.]
MSNPLDDKSTSGLALPGASDKDFAARVRQLMEATEAQLAANLSAAEVAIGQAKRSAGYASLLAEFRANNELSGEIVSDLAMADRLLAEIERKIHALGVRLGHSGDGDGGGCDTDAARLAYRRKNWS